MSDPHPKAQGPRPKAQGPENPEAQGPMPPKDPLYLEALARFEGLLAQAEACEGLGGEPAAMTLATVDAEGRPNARVVLLKGVDERGFVFYTNFESLKGAELGANPDAALCFYWGALLSQVRVRGAVERVSEQEADAYFQSRPRESQLGAWASRQSEPLDEMATLEGRFERFAARFEGVEVPRPAHWGGARVVPDRIEFWAGRPHRLHERLVYTRAGGQWRLERLYP